MRLFIFFFLSSVLFFSCQPEKSTTGFDQLRWIEGTWADTTRNYTFVEQWKKTSDTAYEGNGWIITKGDTLLGEKLFIKERAGKIVYLANVLKQNDGKTVPFALTSSTKDTLRFENPSHDFPQQITYRRKSPTSTEVTVQGIQNGSQRVEYFQLVRQN